MLFDNAVCNPHAALSILFPPCCLTMWCATHTPHCLFLSLYVVWWCRVQPTCLVIYFFPSVLFDDAVCNPHAASSIAFPPCYLMMWHATHMPCHLFLSLHVVWWCSVQPTCCVVYFFLFLFLYILLDFIRSVLQYNLWFLLFEWYKISKNKCSISVLAYSQVTLG